MPNSFLYFVLIIVVALLSIPFNRNSMFLSKMQQRVVPTPAVVAPQEKVSVRNTTDQGEWGVAKKIGEHTYTIKVGEDARMATAQEVVDALNVYRHAHGAGDLIIEQKLQDYAQTRADFFQSSGTTDAHAGFSHFLDNEDGFTKLGFSRLGENSYYGGPLFGVHVIEWVFAKSPEHNANQLDAGWTSVGVGTNSTAVNLIFGGSRL